MPYIRTNFAHPGLKDSISYRFVDQGSEGLNTTSNVILDTLEVFTLKEVDVPVWALAALCLILVLIVVVCISVICHSNKENGKPHSKPTGTMKDHIICASDLLNGTVQPDKHLAEKENKPHGEIYFTTHYSPQEEKLTVIILECRNLNHLIIGDVDISNPLINAELRNGKRRLKKKIYHKKSTPNSCHNTAFIFELPPEEIGSIDLTVTVFHHAVGKKNKLMGQVIVSADADGSPHQHWVEMVQHPGKYISQWHRLQQSSL